MSASPSPPCHRRPWAAYAAIALTAAACVAALFFRAPLLGRYWAFRLMRTEAAAERQALVVALCRLGPSARWGAEALLGSAHAEDRQCAIVVLQSIRRPWARSRLLDALCDPDPDVRHSAAVALALRGEDEAVPVLKWFYQCGDINTACSACIALEQLGTPEATRVLNELAAEDAEVGRRAALVDALAGIGTPACVPGLLRLLDDHRVCDQPPRSVIAAQRIWQHVQGHPQVPALATLAVSSPAQQTVAERAAAALARITGLELPFSSESTADQQQECRRQWERWYAERQSKE